MSLTVFLIILFVLAAISTLATSKHLETWKNKIMSFIQYFLGYLFIVSGSVKAIDPLGTSYKMEEYFQEFQSLFEPTWFSFLVPFFHYLEQFSLGIGIIMILAEMILGIMLIIGFRPKLTTWLYLWLMLFFTILTGYTFLTGYVPQGVNFFEFSGWSEFAESNMKVTDCGCFGDFIKISAYHTFLKNIFFLIPIIYMLFRNKDMHQFFNSTIRHIIVFSSIAMIYIFNLANYSWDNPMVDFRPFKEGVNIREQLKLENNALANIQEKAIILQNKESNKIVEIPSKQYYATSDQFPSNLWTIKDRTYTDPTVPTTEISDMAFEDFEGNDFTEEILANPNYSLLVISWKMLGDPQSYTYTKKDTVFSIDTVFINDTIFVEEKPFVNNDSFYIVKTIQKISDIEMTGYNYIWDKDYLKSFIKTINPVTNDAKKDNLNVFAVVSGTQEMVDDFIKDGGPDLKYYNSDDITLKTIIRSNPGIVLMKDGVVIKKWHFEKLPNYNTIKQNYLK